MQDTEFTRAMKALAEDEKRLQDDQSADRIAELESECLKLFNDIFGCAPDRVSGPIVEKDGITLQMVGERRFRAFAVVDLCPICGEKALSEQRSSANELAQIIVDFKPGWEHNATHPIEKDSVPSSPEQRLVDAIRELVSEFAAGG